MELSYLDYLFLDLFSTDEPRKLTSLYHIITGKRTVSVLLQAMRLELGAYFSLFPKLQMPVFENRIGQLTRMGLITGDCQLTARAQDLKESFFMTHTRAGNKNQLKYQVILPAFKARSLFLTQVLSERMHHNKKYLPIQARLSEQLWLKYFLQKHHLNAEKNCRKLGEEWLFLLARPEIGRPDIFVEQFEGHQKTRLTTRQMGEKYGLDDLEIYVQLQQDWVGACDSILANQEGCPLLAALLAELTEGGGLCTQSSQETYQLWSQGLSIEEIAQKRFLKPSTINDHLTEMAILYKEFPFEAFLTMEQLDYVKNAAMPGEPIDYNDIQKKFPEVTFFQSRLMQIKGGMAI